MNELEQKEFDELSAFVKANGYMKLDTMDKRHRYSELLKKSQADTEQVTLSRSELQKMIDKSIDAYKEEAKKMYVDDNDGLDEAKRIGKWIKSKQPKKENNIARLRVFREDGVSEPGVIIDWKYLKKAFNEVSRKHDIDIYRITVMYKDENDVKTYDIPHLDWIQINEFETVEIVKQDIEDQVMSQGTGQKPFTKGGYAFSDPGLFGTKAQLPGDSFDYEVRRKAVVCTVKRPSGETFVIEADRLNQ